MQIKKIFIFFCFLPAVWLWSQEADKLVEGWEIRQNLRQPPEKVMDAMGLKAGMTVADIGAGYGRFALWFSFRVGPEGRVLANDIDDDALQHMKERFDKVNFKNITIIRGEVVHPNLPDNSCDFAFITNTYHHLDKPILLIRNIIPALKKEGKLIIVECDPAKAPNMAGHSTPRDTMIAQAGRAGYELVKLDTFLKEDNVYHFKVRK